jgi:hypothetical protein
MRPPTECAVSEQPVPVSFVDEAAAVMRRLRSATRALVGATSTGVHNSQDLQKLFGLDGKLSWQVFKLAGPGEPLALAPHVPNPVPMRRFLSVSRKHGLPKDVIAELSAAYEDFERLVGAHAGDRTTLDSMARACSNGDGEHLIDLQHRKAAFKCQSHYWGVQTQTRLVTYLLHPGSGPGGNDVAQVRALLGLHRLRPNADLVADVCRLRPDTGEPDHYRRDMLDPQAAAEHGTAIVPHFCTRPLPRMASQRLPNDLTRTEIVGDDVGRRSAADLVFGHAWRDAPLDTDAATNRPCFRANVWVRQPTVLLIVDMLAHRKTFPTFQCRLQVLDEWDRTIEGGKGPAGTPAVELPFRDRVMQIDGGVDSASLREVPRYREMLQFTADRFGWTLDDFDVYRFRMEYPLHHTTLNFHYVLDSK